MLGFKELPKEKEKKKGMSGRRRAGGREKASGGRIVGGGEESGRQGIETCPYIRFERGRLHVLAPQAAYPCHRSP